MNVVRTNVALTEDDISHGRMIRQPYRITMAKWNCDVHQKRILTAIIASLQKELARVEQGASVAELAIFDHPGHCITIDIPMKVLNPSGNNYSLVHKSLQSLEEKGIEMSLPEVKGRKGPSVNEQAMLFRIKRLPKKTTHMARLKIEKTLITELLRTTSGLTGLSMDVLFRLRSPYSMRLYEILSHWKDRETLRVSLEQLRGWLGTEGKLMATREFLRKVINPAKRQFDQTSDVYFEVVTERTANRISHLVFRIRQKKNKEAEDMIIMQLREQIQQILRIRFRWKEDQFQQIRHLLNDERCLRSLNEKIARLWQYHDQFPEEIRNLQQWSLSALLKEDKGKNK